MAKTIKTQRPLIQKNPAAARPHEDKQKRTHVAVAKAVPPQNGSAKKSQ
jgi:hypothetical protein